MRVRKIIYECDEHVLIINMSFWSHRWCTIEELVQSVQTRLFFNIYTLHLMRKCSMQIARGSQATDYRED